MRRHCLLSLALALLCPCSLVAAEQPPIEVDSPHFHLVTTAGEKQGRHILDNFEHMRWVFATLYPKANIDPPTPILVFAVKNKKEFETLEPSAYLAKGQLNLAGYFLTASDNNFILVRLDAEQEHPFSTVYHEYTHLQFRSAQDWMPLWLNEGVAEFFQNTEFHEKQVLLGQPSVDDILYLRQNTLIPLPTLFRVDHDSPYYHEENKGSVFYAESWALTHYLQVNDRLHNTNRMGDYTVRMSRHEDPVAAAEAAFGDLKKLQTDLAFYIQQSQYKQFMLNSAAAPIDPATYTVRNLTAPEFNSDRAEFLAYIGRKDEARVLLDSVLKSDPTNAQAAETMGELTYREGNIGAARDWYAKAVALDSKSFLANYYYAALSMSTGGGDPRIEASLRTAIRLNPRFAPSYDMLAQLCSRQPEKTDEARQLELNAIQLDPSNLNYRLNAASLHERRGDYDSAKRVLEAARPLARNEGSSSMLEARLREIDLMHSSQAKDASIPTQPAEPTSGSNTTTRTIFHVRAEPPKHPTEPTSGPRHEVTGSIRSVSCSGGSSLELTLEDPGSPKPVVLYTNDRTNMDLTTTNFDLPDKMDPCDALKGYQAEAHYTESSDKTVDGQILSLKLHKGPAVTPLRHPTEPATTHRHQIAGSIRSVNCYGDTSLELTFDVAARPKPLLLYTNDRVNMDLTAFGFTPTAPLDPCTALRGYRAEVMYAESSDKTVDGQIVAVMLRKQPAK